MENQEPLHGYEECDTTGGAPPEMCYAPLKAGTLKRRVPKFTITIPFFDLLDNVIVPPGPMVVIDGRDESRITLDDPKAWTIRRIIHGMISHPHYQGDQGDHHYLENIELVRPHLVRTVWGS